MSFQSMIAAALKDIRKAEGVMISYTDGTYTAAPFTAGIGSTEVQEERVDGQINVYRLRDFLIGVSDLVLNNVAIKPQVLHRITEGGHTFEVANVGGERCWHWSDAGRTQYRVHTKEVNGP